MAGSTSNEIVVDAPIDYVWALTNDIRRWRDLFTEYADVEVLTESPTTVTFRLTMHPDENGKKWSWVSERVMDKATWSVDSRRIETGPFEFMKLRWTYQAIDAEHTRMVWSQDFHLKPEAPIDDTAMLERLSRNTVIQQKAVKAAVEELRTRVIDKDDVPANRRRGADLRTMLSPPGVGSTAGFSGTVLLEPGEVITEHYHPYSEEFIHVVEGALRIDVAGEARVAGADQAVFIPRNTRHRIVNDSGARVRVVFFLSPLAPRPDLGHVDTESLEDIQGTADETNRGNRARSGGTGRQHA